MPKSHHESWYTGRNLAAEGGGAARPQARNFELRILNFELLKSQYVRLVAIKSQMENKKFQTCIAGFVERIQC
jgi:hypothetical protein